MPRIDSGVYRPHDGPSEGKAASRIALVFSRSAIPTRDMGQPTTAWVGTLICPTPRESPGTISPNGNPNGVNPAGSGIPSGCKSRLVLRMEGETNNYGLEMGMYDPGSL